MFTIYEIANYSYLIPLVIGFIMYKKLDKTMTFLLIFLISYTITDSIAYVFAYLYENNLTVLNISLFFKLNISIILFSTFEDIKIKNFNILFLIPFFIIIWIVFYSTGIDSFKSYTSFSSLLARLICLFFEFIYLFNLSTLSKNIIYKSHIFWILVGVITIDVVSIVVTSIFMFVSIYEIVNIVILIIILHFIAYPSFTLAFYFYNKQYNENIKNQLS